MRLRISSRQSDLAKIQAYQVGETLQAQIPDLEVEYMFRESLGDQNQHDPLWKMPEKGVFTEDFYKDLVEDKTDLVVHSWKDLPVEEKAETYIAATLPRADQRDLLLFKKSSQEKSSRKVRIFTSSPRRAHHLGSFLKAALPGAKSEVEFANVRGNVPTRIRKLLEDPEMDGLIVAKAGLDRLLSATRPEFQETQKFLRSALEKLNWMVLPLFQNPNAAAQGSLAIEVSRKRKDVQDIVSKIHCSLTYEVTQRERQIFSSYGGGCHQKIGVSVLQKPYARIEYIKGETSRSENLDLLTWIPEKPVPWSQVKPFLGDLKIEQVRTGVPKVSLPKDCQALWISRTEALISLQEKPQNETVLWAAGWQTWQKLAQAGYWIHGCGEGLGEDEVPSLKALKGRDLKWARLTHLEAPQDPKMVAVATYQVQIHRLEIPSQNENFFFWKSGSQFEAAFKQNPNLKNQFHACGPGRTYETLCRVLGNSDRVYIFLNEAHWRQECQNPKNYLNEPKK